MLHVIHLSVYFLHYDFRAFWFWLLFSPASSPRPRIRRLLSSTSALTERILPGTLDTTATLEPVPPMATMEFTVLVKSVYTILNTNSFIQLDFVFYSLSLCLQHWPLPQRLRLLNDSNMTRHRIFSFNFP